MFSINYEAKIKLLHVNLHDIIKEILLSELYFNFFLKYPLLLQAMKNNKY